MPLKWVVVLACLAMAAVFVERAGVLYRPTPPAKVAAEDALPVCPPAQRVPATELQPPDLPSVTQPGGIDPLGASRAIQIALEDCPEPSAIR